MVKDSVFMGFLGGEPVPLKRYLSLQPGIPKFRAKYRGEG